MANKKISLSIIIPIYNRTQFVNYAINSIINSNISQELIEVIVITNIDIQINIKNEYITIKIIKTDLTDLLPKIKIGVQEACSNIIAFLEDDDIWINNKVSHVIAIFNKYPKVNFYHNSNIQFRGFPKENHYEYLDDNFLKLSSSVIKNSPKLVKTYASKFNCGYNLSSIAIRRNLVLSHLKLFDESQTYGVDSLIFLIALAYGNYLYVDKNIQTLIRIHEYNSFRYGNNNNYIDFHPISNLLYSFKDVSRIYVKKLCFSSCGNIIIRMCIHYN